MHGSRKIERGIKFLLRDSRASARENHPTREKVTRVSPFLAWGDFHARSRFARSSIAEQKWGTTRGLRAAKTLYTLSVKRKSSMIVYEGSRTGRTRLENSWISEFFSTRSKCLKFFFIHFGPGKSLTFDRGTFFHTSKTLWQMPVWRQQNKIGFEEMKVCRTHKRIFIKIAALIWKRCVTDRLGPWNS